MKVSDIKKHVCAIAGDTTTSSRLYRDFSMDYINWSVKEIERKLRRALKDPGGLFLDETDIDAEADTSLDYVLPVDFGSLIHASGTDTNANELQIHVIGTDRALQIAEAGLADRIAAFIYTDKTTGRRRIRYYFPEGVTPSLLRIKYNRSAYDYTSNDEEVAFFPPTAGFEKLIILGAAAQAWLLYPSEFKYDPSSKFESAMFDMVADCNSDAPDTHDRIPREEGEKFDLRMEGEPY